MRDRTAVVLVVSVTFVLNEEMRPFTIMPARERTFWMSIGASLMMTAVMATESANWPGWRGPDANGSAENGRYPVRLDPTNALWIANLPGKGSSTPVVWDGRIFLTAPTNDLDSVLAFDWSGKLQWISTFGTQSPGAHPNGSGCNPSPTTDGRGLFVRFKSGTLAGLDLRGRILWQTNLIEGFGPENLYWDQGTSPVLTRNDVIVARMHGGDSWLAAFDKKTGQLHWKIARNYETPVEGDHAYSTPLVIQQEGKEAILVLGAQRLTANAADDGKLLWVCGGFNPQNTPNVPIVASPVIAGSMAIVACGRADRGQPRLYGIKLGGSGDVTATHSAWKREDTGTFVPTPAEYEGRVYLLRDRGEVECLDPDTGKTVWKGALPKSSHNFYSSPLVTADKLYAAREDGVVFVAKIKNGLEVLGENKMGEKVIASPIAIPNRLLIRGEHHLFCFAAP
jgi:outer membrane protein assembly factor BamB